MNTLGTHYVPGLSGYDCKRLMVAGLIHLIKGMYQPRLCHRSVLCCELWASYWAASVWEHHLVHYFMKRPLILLKYDSCVFVTRVYMLCCAVMWPVDNSVYSMSLRIFTDFTTTLICEVIIYAIRERHETANYKICETIYEIYEISLWNVWSNNMWNIHLWNNNQLNNNLWNGNPCMSIHWFHCNVIAYETTTDP